MGIGSRRLLEKKKSRMPVRNKLIIFLSVTFFGGILIYKLSQPTIQLQLGMVENNPARIGKKAADSGLIKEKISQPVNKVSPSSQIQALKKTVLDSAAHGEIRQKNLYMLTQNKDEAATRSLAEIAQSEVPEFEGLENPHSRGFYKQKAELALRVTALEELDQRAVTSSDLRQIIQEVEQKQKNQTLKFLAQISLSGLIDQKPGKLHRVIEAILSEKD